MTLKTLAYVVIALALAFGLLKGVWTLSGSLMQTEQPAPAAVEPQPTDAGQPATADTSATGQGEQPGTEQAPEAVKPAGTAKPAVQETEGIATKSAPEDEGFYDDGVSNQPSTFKQERQDKPDPYAADEREEESAEVPFNEDDRENDRPAQEKTDGVTLDPYAPDDREAN